jgi:cysteinyl-tRNA synthetase
VNYDDFQKKQTKEIGQLVADLRKKFVAAMDDDFNMPKGLAVLFDIVTIGNKYLERGSEAGAEANAIKNLVREILDIFAIGFKIKRSMRMERGDIERLIAQRAQLKANKQYQKADKIRKELGEQGIILEDTKEGTAWRNRL